MVSEELGNTGNPFCLNTEGGQTDRRQGRTTQTDAICLNIQYEVLKNSEGMRKLRTRDINTFPEPDN